MPAHRPLSPQLGEAHLIDVLTCATDDEVHIVGEELACGKRFEAVKHKVLFPPDLVSHRRVKRQEEASQPLKAVLDQLVAQAAETAHVPLAACGNQRPDQRDVVNRMFDIVIHLEGLVGERLSAPAAAVASNLAEGAGEVPPMIGTPGDILGIAVVEERTAGVGAVGSGVVVGRFRPFRDGKQLLKGAGTCYGAHILLHRNKTSDAS